VSNTPAEPRLDILCEDGPVVAVNKPPGVIVQGAPRGVESLTDQVRKYLKAKYDKPGNVYLGVPHRLDRPVSGVVVFSRNSKCAARLSEQFAKRQVKKVYRSLLERPPEAAEGTLVDWLYRVPEEDRPPVGRVDNPSYDQGDSQHKVIVVAPDHPEAKQAVLHYRTLWTGKGRALVEIELETGRMHQIRVQFASRGSPILGDVQYGARTKWQAASAPSIGHGEPTWRDRPIALHAWRLTILHPVRYDELTITAPLPNAWRSFGLPESCYD
jgi:23S rRNA pseudouridine1911/1915/1917 synthase